MRFPVQIGNCTVIAHNMQVSWGDKFVFLQQTKRWFRIEGMSSSQSDHFSARKQYSTRRTTALVVSQKVVAYPGCSQLLRLDVPFRKNLPISCHPFIGCSNISIIGRIGGFIVIICLLDGWNRIAFRIRSIIDATTVFVLWILLAHVLFCWINRVWGALFCKECVQKATDTIYQKPVRTKDRREKFETAARNRRCSEDEVK
jgi:hypothetical protein